MFTWQKLGKVFTPQKVEGRSWLKEFAQAPATLVCDDFVRVYFSFRPLQTLTDNMSAIRRTWIGQMFQIRNVAAQPILRLEVWESSTSSGAIN